ESTANHLRSLRRQDGSSFGNPAKLVIPNFCRLCDLRSREVCLYRAPKDLAGTTAHENQVGTSADDRNAVNLSESTLRSSTMSTAIFLRLTHCSYETKLCVKRVRGMLSGI